MADVRSQGTTRTTLNDNFGGIKRPNEFARNENEAPALAFSFPQNFLNFGLFVKSISYVSTLSALVPRVYVLSYDNDIHSVLVHFYTSSTFLFQYTT